MDFLCQIDETVNLTSINCSVCVIKVNLPNQVFKMDQMFYFKLTKKMTWLRENHIDFHS